MLRLGKLRNQVNDRLKGFKNDQEKSALEHLYNVSMICGLLAMRRGLDVEICQCAGLLHDLWLYRNLPLRSGDDHKKHGHYGSEESREILHFIGDYTQDEIDIICSMIYNHNDKNMTHGEYEETLKDADALTHYLRNSEYDKKYNYEGRHYRVLTELGIEASQKN